MSDSAEKYENKENDRKLFKDLRKVRSKISEEIASSLAKVVLEEDGPQKIEKVMRDASGNNKWNLGKETKTLLKEHQDADKEGKKEFLVKYLESLGSDDDVSDPYGNGDQSKLRGFEAMKLRTQWASGLDYNPETNWKLSNWCKACFFGDKNEVQKYISGINSEEDKKRLLEKRESMIRFCGILHVICGARMNPCADHISIAQILIEAGCRLDVKDVAGYTAVHHCLTQYGNSTTLKIAQLLVENGANVNTVNRFGCSPLFEPCMNSNYEFIEFLISNGADPSLKDNDGISCQGMAITNPRISSIFSRGYRAKAKLDRAHNSDQDAPVCSYCGAPGKLSKCAACLSVKYCSRACQSHDWKIHKPSCKSKQAERKAAGESVYVKPVINPYGAEILMFNEKTKSVDKTKKGKGKPQKPVAEKAMKIKIQASVY